MKSLKWHSNEKAPHLINRCSSTDKSYCIGGAEVHVLVDGVASFKEYRPALLIERHVISLEKRQLLDTIEKAQQSPAVDRSVERSEWLERHGDCSR